METALLLLSSGSVSWLHGFRVRFLFKQCLSPRLPTNPACCWILSTVSCSSGQSEGAIMRPAHSWKVFPSGSTKWNFTHYTYTCSSGGLKSDTLHLHLQGPRGCTRSRGILHPTLPALTLSRFSRGCWKETEKTKQSFAVLLHDETFATFLFLADFYQVFFFFLFVCSLFLNSCKHFLISVFLLEKMVLDSSSFLLVESDENDSIIFMYCNGL